jgi:PHP family Zn ribbon phosphoesterase
MQTKFLHLGNELDVLLRVPEHSLTGVYEKVAKAIILCREGKVRYEAGFDGQYGKPMFDLEEGKEKTIQRSVGEFT